MGVFIDNLIYGARIAMFKSCPRAAIKPSWDALWFVVFLTAVLSIVMQYLGTPEPNYFYENGVLRDVVFFALTGFSAYAVTKIFKGEEQVLALMVTLYNGLFVIVLLKLILVNLGWLDKDYMPMYAKHLFSAWAFMVIFRSVGLCFSENPMRHVVGSTTVWAILTCGMAQFYFYHYWYSAHTAQVEQSALMNISIEDLLYAQQGMIDTRVKDIKFSKLGRVDVYGIVAGTFAYQDVFKREVEYIVPRLKSVYPKMDGRIIPLVNNPDTVLETPLATVTNLRSSLKGLKSRFQKHEDIIMLYLTSHGGNDGSLVIDLEYELRLNTLEPETLKELLDESGIEYRILILSSCFSGAAIEALKDENTLIITAAAKDKTSFGCSDDSDMTYFGKAYFQYALGQTFDPIKAFDLAKARIESIEKAEGITPSDPQIFIGENIERQLHRANLWHAE